MVTVMFFRLVIRIFADSPDAYSLGGKFGCGLSKSEELIQLAKSMELDIVGVRYGVVQHVNNDLQYII